MTKEDGAGEGDGEGGVGEGSGGGGLEILEVIQSLALKPAATTYQN